MKQRHGGSHAGRPSGMHEQAGMQHSSCSKDMEDRGTGSRYAAAGQQVFL